MNQLLAQAQQMQEQMQQAQAELAETTFDGSAGGGLVTVKMNGTGDLTSVDIKPEACDPEDTDSLGDLVVAAVRDAMGKVQAMTEAKLGGFAGGGPFSQGM
ncbi:YbaB/EbfC family nucleoid-associated protein [Propioniferax innocua]|nr:YbaB/EbfC family nucleoid-associated protein [Propioniferax innocua]